MFLVLSYYVVSFWIGCLVCCLYTVNEYATHQAPDSETYYIIRRNQKLSYLNSKYNFILYLILHCKQLYFNYIPTVF